MKMFQHKKKEIVLSSYETLNSWVRAQLCSLFKAILFNTVRNISLFFTLFLFSTVLLKLNIKLHKVLIQAWAGDAPWAGCSLHRPKSHAALQPRKSLARRTRRSQAREASEQAGQGPTGACGNSRDQEQRGLSPREREGAGWRGLCDLRSHQSLFRSLTRCQNST